MPAGVTGDTTKRISNRTRIMVLQYFDLGFGRTFARLWSARAGSLCACLASMLCASCGRWPLDGVDPAAPDSTGSDAAVAETDFTFVEDDDPLVSALPFVENELLARILPGAQADDLDRAYEQAGVEPVRTLEDIETVAVTVCVASFHEAAATLAAHPAIESVHKSYLYDAQALPNDTEISYQTHIEMVGLPQAWDLSTGDEAIVIAIVDTGVDRDHPDLQQKLLAGRNIYANSDDADDVWGHGTAVAGTAAAMTNNRLGVAGVAWDNPLMPVRVSNSRGMASSRDIAGGIVWAVRHGARVINVSFAPLASDSTVLAAARYARNAGRLVFISSGNSGERYRARDTSDAVFVGAVDGTGELAFFSDYGAFVDIVAPGTDIRTTAMGGGYRRANGTSFASPIAAGVAALVWSVNPDLRPVTVEGLIFGHAIDLGDDGRDEFHGHGMVDASGAVEAALNVVEPEDNVPPEIRIIEPLDGAVVTGYVRIPVSAVDGLGVADVVLSIDGQPFATDTAKPYRFTINTQRLSPGRHTISAVATDRAGNSAEAEPVDVWVVAGETGGGSEPGDADGGTPASADEGEDVTPPTITLMAPVDGTLVFQSVAVQVELSDDYELHSVVWLVDGVRHHSQALDGALGIVTFWWDAESAEAGDHQVVARVLDSAGNESVASVMLVKQ